jgi:hypothetical protein
LAEKDLAFSKSLVKSIETVRSPTTLEKETLPDDETFVTA